MSERVIIDVREPFEFATGHVKGAINIPPTELMHGTAKLNSFPKDSEIIVYCRSGARARTATMLLMQQGFTNIVNGINQDVVKAKYT